MVTTSGFIIAALMIYIGATAYLFSLLKKRQNLQHNTLGMLTGSAILCHGIGLYAIMVQPEGFYLGIDKVFALMMFSINIIVAISSLRKPLHNLFILLFPITVLSLITTVVTADHSTNNEALLSNVPKGISLHIILSIIAYSLLSMAVLQALLLHWQNSHLKNHQPSGLIKHLPPLQTMESLMFELLWIGVILLTCAILLGVFYIENIFAQHLTHKTALSIMAWIIFSILLWGRVKSGWRGNQAIRWVLGGFCMLMLAYFGSKLALEVILV